MKRKILIVLAVCLIVSLVALASYAAVIYTMTSNTVTVTVTAPTVIAPTAAPTASPTVALMTLTLTTNKATVAMGEIEPLKIYATCSDTHYNGNVSFYAGTTFIGWAFAMAGTGVAGIYWIPTETGTYTLTAIGTYPY